MCVYDQNYTLVIVTRPKQRNVLSVSTGRLSFHISFNYAKSFLSGYMQFWRINFLDMFLGAFVCVCDQNYALLIVTQPKESNVESVSTGRLSFHFSFKY